MNQVYRDHECHADLHESIVLNANNIFKYLVNNQLFIKNDEDDILSLITEIFEDEDDEYGIISHMSYEI